MFADKLQSAQNQLLALQSKHYRDDLYAPVAPNGIQQQLENGGDTMWTLFNVVGSTLRKYSTLEMVVLIDQYHQRS